MHQLSVLHARLGVCLGGCDPTALLHDWSGFLAVSGGNLVQSFIGFYRSKGIGKMFLRSASWGASFALWVTDAQDEVSFVLFSVCCSGSYVPKGLRRTSAFCSPLFFGRVPCWCVMGWCTLKGLNQLSHSIIPTGRFITRSLHVKLGKPTNQPVDHDYAAPSCHRCVTAGKHPNPIGWVGGRGGRGWTWDVPDRKHILRRGIRIFSAHFEPRETRWNSQEQTFCE